MTTFPVLPPPVLPPGIFASFGAINPTPPPSTIPIRFISDLGTQPGKIVSQAGVLTGIPFNQSVSGGAILLPLPPLPTPIGARVSIPPGAYPMEYQAAGSKILEAAANYTAAAAVYGPQLTTFLGSASWATYVAAGETQAALLVLFGTSDFLTWQQDFSVVANAYGLYISAYNSGQSALNWWSTYASAVLFQNANPLAANPYSSSNAI